MISLVKSIFVWCAACLCANTFGAVSILPPTGPQPSILNSKEQSQQLYDHSYALMINVAHYFEGGAWRNLENTTKEVDDISSVLRAHGFQVTRVIDPNGAELRDVINKFLTKEGREENSRIIILFSGHGYLDKGSDQAYFVPADAGSPLGTSSNFFREALVLEDFRLQVMRMPAKHGLFIFDNCFSGMIFKAGATAAMPVARGSGPVERWKYLDRTSKTPVRQFISAGGPDDVLPSVSEFARQLQQGLLGAAARQQDGYVTGKEIGLFISEQVLKLTRIMPLSDVLGKNLGDMIFQIPRDSSFVQSPKMTLSSKAADIESAAISINLVRDLDSDIDLQKISAVTSQALPLFNRGAYRDARDLYRKVSSAIPHWYFPVRMEFLAGCRIPDFNSKLSERIKIDYQVDDVSVVNCQSLSYTVKNVAVPDDLVRWSRRAYASGNFKKTIIVGPDRLWGAAMGQWKVNVEKNNSTVSLHFFDGWVAGKRLSDVNEIFIGLYNRYEGWKQLSKNVCRFTAPKEAGNLQTSILAPYPGAEFRCDLEIESKVDRETEIVLAFDFDDEVTYMYSVGSVFY